MRKKETTRCCCFIHNKMLYIYTPDHPWMREDGASDKPLDVAVLSRMKQFRAMNKLKKVALKVNNILSSFLLY